MVMKKVQIVSTLAVMVLALLLCSCKKEEAPAVPTTRWRTLNRLFLHLEKKQYREALKQVEHYQTLDDTNPFLNEMTNILRTNICIAESEKLAAAGKLDEACAYLDEREKEYGELPGIKEAQNMYRELAELQHKLDALKDPASIDRAGDNRRSAKRPYSETMLEDARWVANYAARKNNRVLQNFARKKIQQVQAMRQMESDRAGLLLYADTMEAVNAHDPSMAFTMTSILRANRNYHIPLARVQHGGLFFAPYMEEKLKNEGDKRPEADNRK